GERLAVRAGVGGTAGAFGLCVQFFDENGGWISEIPVGSLSGSQSFNTQIAGFVQAPANAKLMRLICYATASTPNVDQTVTFTEPMITKVTAQQATVPAFTSGIPNKSALLAGSRSATYSRTSFVYDQSGMLLSRQTDGRNQESYIYDGLGRLTSAVDVNGGMTTYVFNDASTTTTVSFASGLIRTSTYNKAGELISFAETAASMGSLTAATGTATYGYDHLGQLRYEIDGTNRKTYHLYDNVSRKVADISAAGEFVEYKYDAANRLVATVRYTTTLPSGALTNLDNLSVAADIGNYRPASSGTDSWSWRIYDEEGRLLQAISGDG